MNFRHMVADLTPRSRLYLATAIYGLVGGGIAVVFHLCIHFIYSHTIEAWSHGDGLSFALKSLALMLSAALLSGWLVNKRCPEAAGSGIPQLKLAFWKDFGWLSPRLIWVKFVAGAVSIGSGMSMGREGPSVQLAGATSSWIATRMGVAKQKHRMPAAAGAAAGLAAAFNTPLAAVTFVLEEIIGDLNSRFLGNMLMASVIGAIVVHGVLGPEPAFSLSILHEPGWKVYLLTPWAAVLATLAGLLFQWMSLQLRGWSHHQKRVPSWLLPLIGALVTWTLGMAVWFGCGKLGVFGLGYEDLSAALSGNLGWQLAALLLFTKLIATAFCYGLGGCGGIFSPTLFLGGMAGLLAAGIGGYVLPLDGSDYGILAVVGMCACLGAVVRAPVTGILIVFEMTHQFSLVLPLMLAALISQALSRRLMKANFYDAVLEQDGHHLSRIIPPRDLESWQELPITTIANFQPAALSDFKSDTLTNALEKHPYKYFPILQNERVTGVLHRREIEVYLENPELTLTPKLAPLAQPQESIGLIQGRLIESGMGIVLLCDEDQALLGIVTLHDLLRAQMSYGGGLEK